MTVTRTAAMTSVLTAILIHWLPRPVVLGEMVQRIA